MNYYVARRRQKDGILIDLWDWTCQNGDAIWPMTPCSLSCEHKTREEAERHHYEYEIETRKRVTFEQADKCVECGEWTDSSFEIGHGIGRLIKLCEKCGTEEAVRKHDPFVPGCTVMSS